jgi:copper transport protein
MKQIWRARARRSLMMLALAAAACVTTADLAGAHATLTASNPRDGVLLSAAPANFTLTFNEPVAPLVFHVFAPDGREVPVSVQAIGRTIILKPSQALGQGTHLISWRVVSADGHPVSGGLQFSVGRVSESAPIRQTGPDRPVQIAIWLARIAIYGGLFVGIGGAFFAAWIAAPLPRNAAIAISASMGVALAAVPFSISFQGLDALAAPLASLWRPAVCSAGFHTSYGVTATIAGASLLCGLAALLMKGVIPVRLFATVALFGASLALASSGHASVASPQMLMRPTVFVHAAAVALWAGSLVPLCSLVLCPQRSVRPMRRFSRMIPFVLVALAATGIVLAAMQIAQWSALWATAYGRIFLLKCAALVALAVLAGINRFVLTPAVLQGDESASRRMVWSIGAELVLVAAILLLVALWRFTPPPRALINPEPAFVHIHTEKAMADVTVTPGRTGPVEVTVHVMREDTSLLPAKEVTVLFSHREAGIEPFARPAKQSEPGVWRAGPMSLPQAGIWTIQIDILINDFEKVSLDAPLVLAP